MKIIAVFIGLGIVAVSIIECCIKIGCDSSWYEDLKAEEQDRE